MHWRAPNVGQCRIGVPGDEPPLLPRFTIELVAFDSADVSAVYAAAHGGLARAADVLSTEVLDRRNALLSREFTRQELTKGTVTLGGIDGGIGVLGRAASLAHHELAINLGSGPGSHPQRFVDVRKRPSQNARVAVLLFTESQIVAILKEGEAGVSIDELTRKHRISRATYFNWRGKYGGVSVSELRRMKELEAENAKLKRMYAELALENAAIKDVLSRKL